MTGGQDKESQLAATLAASLGDVLGDAPTLVVLVGEVAVHHILPERGEVSIGRSSACDLVVDHPSISRQHALLHVGDGYSIEDLGSANGVQVRGRRLAANTRAALRVNEVADLGATVFMVRCAGEANSSFEGPSSDEDMPAEKRAILVALAECGGNQTRAAKALGVSRRTLTRRLSEFEIARPLKDRE